MARSRRSALKAHELRCKYHTGPKKNPKIYGSSAKKEKENTHHKDATPTKDERKQTPSPLKCIKEMRAPELLSPLQKTPEKKNVEKEAADQKTDKKKESAEKETKEIQQDQETNGRKESAEKEPKEIQQDQDTDGRKESATEQEMEIEEVAEHVGESEEAPQTRTEMPELIAMEVQNHGRRSIYDHLHSDPRFFFLGAPSAYDEEGISKDLHNLRRRALTETIERNVIFLPPSVDHIRKEESARFIDGTTYTLNSVWYRRMTTLTNAGTQTDAPTTEGTTSDKSTQCSVKLALMDD